MRLSNYEYKLITNVGNKIVIGAGQRAHIISDADKVSRFRRSKKITVACEVISDYLVVRNQEYIKPAVNEPTCQRCTSKLEEMTTSDIS
jgi:hypothetical protein